VRRQLAEVKETLGYERARAERLERQASHAGDEAAAHKLVAELREMLAGLKVEAPQLKSEPAQTEISPPKAEVVPMVTSQPRRPWWRRWVS
jgi:hypothetical protein